MLRSILNKTIRTDTGYIQQLITSDTLADSADFSTFFDKLPVSLIATIGVIAAALLIITVLALVIILRRRKTERKLAAKQNEVAAEMEMNRARREFFGTVSHDMRTPLNGILGFTDLALKSDKPEEVRECLKKIRSSGNVLSGLVNDTLIMSRIENGKYVLHPETNELSDTVQGVLEPIRSIADEKGVALSADISAVQGHWVSADRLSIQKILLNLLSNAVKFTPKGGTVTLKASLEPSNGNEDDSVSVFRVSDNGIGVSKEFLPRMFEPFAQENAPGSDISGSGMGLPIVKSIVEAMKGTIDAESTQGKGTTFTVRLPLLSAKAPKKEDAVKNADTENLKGKKALICEDNSLNMEIIKSILERFGMSVTPCTDGNIGVETFRSSVIGNFDIIFLDLRMPVMGGMQAARAIRGMDRRDAKSVPIFAVSADAYPENVAECLSAGMNGHISKPIDAEQLIRITAEACA
ncbi:MAG: ATP-binding protein [Lachnospiraceae bacterium]|jgi:signal transduction histidine kinase/ActR/RegA family two-component response regulator|nr:ATP-binding protein [Lachnospiraceae bacterium]